MKKILYIPSSSNPFVLQYGGAQRSNLLMNACMQVGEVDVICFDDLPNNIQQDGVNVLFAKSIRQDKIKCSRLKKIFNLFLAWHPVNLVPIDVIREKIIDQFVEQKHYDYIVTRYMHEALEMGLLKYSNQLIVDIDDSPIDKARNAAKLAKTFRNRIYMNIFAKMTDIALRIFIRNIKASFFSNKNDADKYSAAKYRSVFLPNIPFYEPDMEKIDRKNIKKGRLLFVGDLTYAPNYTGLEHFLNDIFPRINRKVELHVVGRIEDEEIKKRWNAIDGVSVLGFVEDLLKEYAEAEIIVIPIYFGAGTCIKVLESMQMKRLLITTPVGTRGYEEYTKHYQDYLLAHNDTEFILSIQEAIDNQNLQVEITTNAHKKVNAYFSRNAFNKIVYNTLMI